MSTAIVYARVSSEEQVKNGTSLEEQIRLCRQRAAELGCPDPMVITDPGESGDAIERPGLRRVRELIRAGGIDYFICLDPDRFSRSLVLQLLVTDEMDRAGTKLVFLNMQREKTPEGQLFYQLRGAVAEFEKAKIRERMMRGKLAAARNGKIAHYAGLYGYRQQNGHLTVDETEAEVIRNIFRWTCQGDSPRQIATRLQEMGIPDPKGRNWLRWTITKILRQTAYIGIYYQNRVSCDGITKNKYLPRDQKIRRKIRPVEEWVATPVPPIVSLAAWKQANHMLDSTRTLRIKKRKFSYLLTGLVRCAYCGSTVFGFFPGNRKTRYYACYHRRSRFKPKCQLRYLPADHLERLVWETVQGWLLNPDSFCRALESPSSEDEEAEMLANQLRSVQQERERLIGLVQKGLVELDEVSKRMEELKSRIESIRAQMKQKSNVRLPAVDIPQALEAVRRWVNEGHEEEKSRLICMLVDKVIVSNAGIEIRARIPGPV